MIQSHVNCKQQVCNIGTVLQGIGGIDTVLQHKQVHSGFVHEVIKCGKQWKQHHWSCSTASLKLHSSIIAKSKRRLKDSLGRRDLFPLCTIPFPVHVHQTKDCANGYIIHSGCRVELIPNTNALCGKANYPGNTHFDCVIDAYTLTASQCPPQLYNTECRYTTSRKKFNLWGWKFIQKLTIITSSHVTLNNCIAESIHNLLLFLWPGCIALFVIVHNHCILTLSPLSYIGLSCMVKRKIIRHFWTINALYKESIH